MGRCWGAAGASTRVARRVFLSSPVGAPENLNWIWCVIYFNRSLFTWFCFAALATIGGWRWAENTTIYTIPYLYHTELPTLSQISGASASAIDRRFEQGDSRISLLLWRAGQRCER